MIIVTMKFSLLLIWLFSLGFLPSNEGKKFSTYTFLATEDVSLGPLGKIESQESGCKKKFQCFSRGYQRSIIVSSTGIIKLIRKPSLGTQFNDFEKPTKVKVTITCYCGYYISKYVTVNLFIFRYNFGDSILKSCVGELGRLVKENKKFDTGRGMAGSLHRMMRMVSKEKDPETFNEMMASARVDAALDEAINEIVKRYTTKYPEQQIVFRWSLNSLFSTQALQQLSNAAQCNRKPTPSCPSNDQYRTIDGTCNNLNNPLFGSAPTGLTRLLPAKYFDPDGFKDPIGFPGQNNVPDIPATFEVVKEFIAQQTKPQMPNFRFSHLVMQFGQFLDHDLDLSPESENSDRCMETRGDGSKEDFRAPCYTIQPFGNFKPIHFTRSASECIINRKNRITTKQQINVNTAFIDGSQIYGSSEDLEKMLRDCENGDKGLLKTSSGILGTFLPEDNSKMMRFPNNLCQPKCFLAGDSRTNEQMVLTCMHTLFVREHNRIARKLQQLNPHWNGEKIYQETRKIVGAVLQKIAYEDYLPIIIGNTLPDYKNYDDKVNPSILNSFSTAAFRFGHSLIRPTFDRLDEGFNPTGDPLPLRQLFFNNTFINKFGVEPLLLGLLGNESQTVDRQLADGILNNLFERPKSPGLNLAALNIQRGRDHGLPGYNAFRVRCGLKNATSFRDTSKEIVDLKNRKLLSQLYNDDPNLADLWVAGLAETPAKGGIVGTTFGCIIREQMRRVRDGDRFFYEKKGVFSDEQLKEIRKTSFSRILCDNLKNIVSVQRDSFQAGTRYNRVSCSRISGIDLNKWKSGNGGSSGGYSCPGCLKGIFDGKFCTRTCECKQCRHGHCYGSYICGERMCSGYRTSMFNRCGNDITNVVDKNWRKLGGYSCPGCLKGRFYGKFCTRTCECKQCRHGHCYGTYVCGERTCSHNRTSMFNRCGNDITNVVDKNWRKLGK